MHRTIGLVQEDRDREDHQDKEDQEGHKEGNQEDHQGREDLVHRATCHPRIEDHPQATQTTEVHLQIKVKDPAHQAKAKDHPQATQCTVVHLQVADQAHQVTQTHLDHQSD